MEEKVIITSENIFASPKTKKWLMILAIILAVGIVFSLLNLFVIIPNNQQSASQFYNEHYKKVGYWDWEWDSAENQKKSNDMWDFNQQYNIFNIVLMSATGAVLLVFIVFLILFLAGRKEHITVTDKRVYGNTSFGKRVDLPIDSISAIAMSAFKGLAVATASGKIKFMGIKNRNDIHSTISNLLIERQGNRQSAAAPAAAPEAPKNAVEELKSFKELLDNGVITQEEFDAKKKQILGL